ncbi:MAG: histidine kinase [Pseudomonadota bacterium]
MPERIVNADAAPEVVESVRWRSVAGALALFWLAFIAMYTARAALLGMNFQFESFVRRSVVAIVGIVLSWLMYRVLERATLSSLRQKIVLTVAMSLPAGCLFAGADVLVFYVIAPINLPVCENGIPCLRQEIIAAFSDLFISWTFVFLAWGMLYLSLASAMATRAADLRASAHRDAARLSEIRALRYQINPHFLFNVLNSLMALVGRGEMREAEALITQIGRFMRYSLGADPLADATLGDEIDMQLSYLELERRRFPHRMTVQVDVSDAAAAALVPSLLLQPLVENAIKHGLGRSSEPVTIRIRASDMPEGRLQIIVEDDARALEGDAAASGLGIGLKNVAERLALHFDGSASCVAGPITPCGFRVALSLPLVRR